MKKMKKLLALLTSVLMLFAFAACAKENDKKKDIDKKADSPKYETLIMGTNAAFPPYEFVADDGSFAGIDVEIAQAVADKLGAKLTIKDMEFNSLITAVSGGAVDFVLAGMTVDEERLESVNFSDSYATGIQSIIVKEGSKIKSADDLKDRKIGVQTGTTGDIYCSKEYGQENVKQYQNGALAVQALLNGQIDCVVIDNEPAKSYVSANKGLTILDTEYALEYYAAAFAKNNDALLKDFNKALAELKADGTIEKIVSKYIKAN